MRNIYKIPAIFPLCSITEFNNAFDNHICIIVNVNLKRKPKMLKLNKNEILQVSRNAKGKASQGIP